MVTQFQEIKTVHTRTRTCTWDLASSLFVDKNCQREEENGETHINHKEIIHKG